MSDVLTVARKELREIVGAGSGRRGLAREALFVGLFGVFFPLMQADAWRSSALPAVFFLLVPLLIAGPHVADSFAGERERKTLETLLATRLTDRAVYVGKIAAACLYAWVVCLLILVTSIAALTLGAGGRLFVYVPAVWVAAGVGSVASALLIAGIGTFVSLRSETVRGAHQAMMIPLFLLIFGGSFGLPALFRTLPGPARAAIVRWADGLGPVGLVSLFVALILLCDLVLLWIGVKRFRRDRLISG